MLMDLVALIVINAALAHHGVGLRVHVYVLEIIAVLLLTADIDALREWMETGE